MGDIVKKTPDSKTVKKVKKCIKKTTKPQAKKTKPNVRVFVAGGSRNGKNPAYAKAAYELGKEIGKQNYQLTFGLSSRGIMGAVAKGVLESWAKNPKNDQKPIEGVTTEEYMRRYDTEKELEEISDIVVAKTLEDRKRHMLNAEFVIFMPGGVGTLDELAFDCVAMQDGLLPKKPFILFNSSGFFHHLLEFLKDIHLKGFADFVPFIVVDNVFEAQIAFNMIEQRYTKQKESDKNTEHILEQIVYDLPYVIEQKRHHPNKPTVEILDEIHNTFKTKTQKEKNALSHDIETAYLNKEIARMYDRLEKSGRDTALVSHKLASLKKRYHKKEKLLNGLY
jgi:uncharacterized protein (TIGR00730 family)